MLTSHGRVVLAAACRVTFRASGAQTEAPACMGYDAAADQFIHVWKLARTQTGAATVTTVAYPGTSTTTTLEESVTVRP